MNPPATEQRPTRVRYVVLGVLCSLAFLTYFDRICIMQVQDDISRDLHFGQLTSKDEDKLHAEGKQDDPVAREQAEKASATARMSWVFWAFILGYGIFEVPGGWMGDRWGARAVLVRIVIWWSIFTAMTGSADVIVGWLTSSPEPWMFLAAMVLVRFVFGLGEAGAYPNIGRAIARWFPFRDRAAATSFIWMSSRIGGAVSPWIILSMSDFLGGWRQAFWVLGAVGIVWAFAFYLWFRDRPEDMPGANRAEANLIRADSGPGSIHDDDGHKNIPWRRLAFSTNLWALYIVASSASFSWYFNVTYLPKYLLEVFKVEFKDSKWFTGTPLLAGAVTCVVGGWISDHLIRRWGSKRWGRSLVGAVGFGMAGLFTLMIPTFHPHWPEIVWPVIVTLCIVSAFQDLAVPIIWTVSADIGERYAGTVAGAMNCMGGVGASLGILLAPRIADYFHDWNVVFLVNGSVYLVGALAWLRVNAAERLVNGEGAQKWSCFPRSAPRTPHRD